MHQDACLSAMILSTFISMSYRAGFLFFNESTKFTNSLKYIEKDLNIEAVWIKFSLEAPKNIKKVKIKASVMTDFFDDQTNLILFKYKNFEEAFKLDNIVLENEFTI